MCVCVCVCSIIIYRYIIEIKNEVNGEVNSNIENSDFSVNQLHVVNSTCRAGGLFQL